MADIDVTEEYRGLSVTDFERRIRASSRETGAIIDSSKGVLRAREGGPHEIEWDDEDCELIPGRVLAHNHPLGDSFSPLMCAWLGNSGPPSSGSSRPMAPLTSSTQPREGGVPTSGRTSLSWLKLGRRRF